MEPTISTLVRKVSRTPLDVWLSLGQGAFWLASGLWPLVHYRSFEAVTGRKKEPWLVKTVGTLLAVVGAALLDAGARRRVDPIVKEIAMGSAAGLTAIDLFYAGPRRRISPVYLLDAAVEGALVAAWAIEGLRARPVSVP